MNAKVCPKVDSVGGTTELIWLGNCLVERVEVDVFFFIFSLPTQMINFITTFLLN